MIMTQTVIARDKREAFAEGDASDEARQFCPAQWIASLALAMTAVRV